MTHTVTMSATMCSDGTVAVQATCSCGVQLDINLAGLTLGDGYGWALAGGVVVAHLKAARK